MHGETAASSGYANADVTQPEDDLTEALVAFSNLTYDTAVDCGVVETLTETNAHLTNQLE